MSTGRFSRLGVSAVLLLSVVSAGQGPAAERRGGTMTVIDFGEGEQPWRSINDVVMGGVSAGAMVIEDGVAVFQGLVSLDNNGGFASVRSLPGKYDLSDFTGIVLRVRGDGRRYGVRLRTSADFDGVSYQVKIQPKAGVRQDLFLPFDRFESVFRGRRVEGHPPLDPARIVTFGLLISDGQEGPFRLELERIEGSTGAS